MTREERAGQNAATGAYTLSLIFVRFRALVRALMREVIFKYALPGSRKRDAEKTTTDETK